MIFLTMSAKKYIIGLSSCGENQITLVHGATEHLQVQYRT